MSDETKMNDEPLDHAMEASLGKLTPVAPGFGVASVLAEGIQRADRLQRIARRQIRIWQGIAMALAASLAWVVWIRRPAPVEQRVVVKIVREQPTEAATLARTREGDGAPIACNYLFVRQQVLSRGLAALPDSSAVSSDVAAVFSGDVLRRGGP